MGNFSNCNCANKEIDSIDKYSLITKDDTINNRSKKLNVASKSISKANSNNLNNLNSIYLKDTINNNKLNNSKNLSNKNKQINIDDSYLKHAINSHNDNNSNSNEYYNIKNNNIDKDSNNTEILENEDWKEEVETYFVINLIKKIQRCYRNFMYNKMSKESNNLNIITKYNNIKCTTAKSRISNTIEKNTINNQNIAENYNNNYTDNVNVSFVSSTFIPSKSKNEIIQKTVSNIPLVSEIRYLNNDFSPYNNLKLPKDTNYIPSTIHINNYYNLSNNINAKNVIIKSSKNLIPNTNNKNSNTNNKFNINSLFNKLKTGTNFNCDGTQYKTQPNLNINVEEKLISYDLNSNYKYYGSKVNNLKQGIGMIVWIEENDIYKNLQINQYNSNYNINNTISTNNISNRNDNNKQIINNELIFSNKNMSSNNLNSDYYNFTINTRIKKNNIKENNKSSVIKESGYYSNKINKHVIGINSLHNDINSINNYNIQNKYKSNSNLCSSNYINETKNNLHLYKDNKNSISSIAAYNIPNSSKSSNIISKSESIDFNSSNLVNKHTRKNSYFNTNKQLIKLVGHFENDKITGFAKLIKLKSNTYNNQSNSNKINNTDKFSIISCFYGELNKNIANSFGIFCNKSNISYTGEWKDDLQHGYGIENSPDNSQYKGCFEYGFKSGIGEYTWNDKSKYIGEWKNNNMHGYGLYKSCDGKEYKGKFINSAMHGFGELIMNSNLKLNLDKSSNKKNNNSDNCFKYYIGNFEKDKKQGFGAFVWIKRNSFKVYFGFWENSKQNGIGKLISFNNKINVNIDFLKDKRKLIDVISNLHLNKNANNNISVKYGIWKNGERIKQLNSLSDVCSIINNCNINDFNYLILKKEKAVYTKILETNWNDLVFLKNIN